MPESDRTTRIAERLSGRMTRVAQRIQKKNSLGFGKVSLTREEYRTRFMAMSAEQRDEEINRDGIDTIMDRLEQTDGAI